MIQNQIKFLCLIIKLLINLLTIINILAEPDDDLRFRQQARQKNRQSLPVSFFSARNDSKPGHHFAYARHSIP